MDKLNVLVVSRLDLHQGYLSEIAAVDYRISAKDGLKQFVAELKNKGDGSPRLKMLERELGRWPVDVTGGQPEDLDSLLAEAEVIFGTGRFPENLLLRAPKLKWIHVGSVGIDYLSKDLFQGSVVVTNGRGSTAVPISEHVLSFILALGKDTRRLLENKQNRKWDRYTTMELCDRVVGIVGLGAIGTEVARLTRAIGMKVVATRRSAVKRERNLSEVDELYPPGELDQMLKESDFVVVTAPLTPETRGMIGEVALRSMKPSAYLINVARGPIVDQKALVRALKEGWIAGAGLDVVEIEPLPADSELWDLPNVILSPHMAGTSDKRSYRVVALFCENLKRYLAGEQLRNVIDIRKAY